jgi:hypothetical protein
MLADRSDSLAAKLVTRDETCDEWERRWNEEHGLLKSGTGIK